MHANEVHPSVRNKEKNSKAFAVLGVDATQAKLISVLGIDMPVVEVPCSPPVLSIL